MTPSESLVRAARERHRRDLATLRERIARLARQAPTCRVYALEGELMALATTAARLAGAQATLDAAAPRVELRTVRQTRQRTPPDGWWLDEPDAAARAQADAYSDERHEQIDTLTDAELDAELRRAGLDPATVVAVILAKVDKALQPHTDPDSEPDCEPHADPDRG